MLIAPMHLQIEGYQGSGIAYGRTGGLILVTMCQLDTFILRHRLFMKSGIEAMMSSQLEALLYSMGTLQGLDLLGLPVGQHLLRQVSIQAPP